ncbi:hypothetical protein G5V59_00315 [Nocardioides sp. W3-2-3]|nr:hypothetical protein [Nocardioides convexus]
MATESGAGNARHQAALATTAERVDELRVDVHAVLAEPAQVARPGSTTSPAPGSRWGSASRPHSRARPGRSRTPQTGPR